MYESKARYKRLAIAGVIVLLILAIAGYVLAHISQEKTAGSVTAKLRFDDSVTNNEKTTITRALQNSAIQATTISVESTLHPQNQKFVVQVYVPVSNFYSARQQITKDEVGKLTIYIPSDTDEKVRLSMAKELGIDNSKLLPFSESFDKLPNGAIAFVPIDQLSSTLKLLTFDGKYYLDSFQSGALFRSVKFEDMTPLNDIAFNSFPTKDTTLKVKMTGVTALTRLMMKKLSSVKDPKYFSQLVGPFLADADFTHVSNEVSFQNGCEYSNASFCAPPEMIETLKASGVDVVELTGNHNNDRGSQYNTETINLYHQLGWQTFGGGLDANEASKSAVVDKKDSKVIFLGYNYADSPSGSPIATTIAAGANSFNFDKIQQDILEAHKQSNFVIVDVQFTECYAYPPGYSEFPECDSPIAGQRETFRRLVDIGADMVIGTQAHQPQTYELYDGKPIYYGLGNLYFEQIQWPGTERGIILTHYFYSGKLLQTKLSPTIYDERFQTHLMDNDHAVSLLARLINAH